MMHFCSVMHHDSLGGHFVLPGKMMWVPHSEGGRCYVIFCGHCLSVVLLVGYVFLLHLIKKKKTWSFISAAGKSVKVLQSQAQVVLKREETEFFLLNSSKCV